MLRSLFAEHRRLSLAVLAASLALSVWAVWIDDVVNWDGVDYLRAASALAAGDAGAAFAIHKWPLYPALIAGMHIATGLPMEISAHVVNALLTALLMLSFLGLVAELGGDRRTLYAAAFLVLLHPGFNDFRAYVIRDFGYWAFYVLALGLFLRHWREPSWGRALSWSAAMLVATLFRIEGLVFLLALPVLSQLRRGLSMRRRLLMLAASVAAVAVVGLGFSWWIYHSNHMNVGATQASDPAFIVLSSWSQLTADLGARIEVLKRDVLGPASADYANTVIVITLLAIVLGETVGKLGIVHAVLVLWGDRRGALFPVPGARAVWLRVILIHVAILCLFALAKLFLTGRYALALGFTLLAAAPFALVLLHARWASLPAGAPWSRRIVFPAVVFVLLVMGIEGTMEFTGKPHIREAGEWVRSVSDPSDRFYSNDKALTYYSGHDAFYEWQRYDWTQALQIAWRGQWRKYDWLAIRVQASDRGQEAYLRQLIGIEPVREFANDEGDRVLVFDTSRR